MAKSDILKIVQPVFDDPQTISLETHLHRKDLRKVKASCARLLSSTRSVARPRLLNIAGIPGSGKSFIANAAHRQSANTALLAFDDIMTSFPEYQKQARCDARKAFENWEMSARIIGYGMLGYLISKKRNVIFEHSSANPIHLELFQNIRAAGYQITMLMVECDPEIAKNRLQHRDRYTPPNYVEERAAILKELKENFKTAVDTYGEFDNSNTRNMSIVGVSNFCRALRGKKAPDIIL